MNSLPQSLGEGGFSLTAQVDPPAGGDLGPLSRLAQALKGRVAALVISDNAGAQVRLTPSVTAAALAGSGAPPLVVTLSCRDRNRLGLTSEMLAAAAAGAEGLLMVSGCHVSLGGLPGARPVHDLDSVQALQVATALSEAANGGPRWERPLALGATVAPAARPRVGQVMKLKKKLAAGAQFILTAPVTQVADYQALRGDLEGSEVLVIPGVAVIDGDLEAAVALAGELKAAGAPGLHLSWPQEQGRLPEILDRLQG